MDFIEVSIPSSSGLGLELAGLGILVAATVIAVSQSLLHQV